MQEVVAAVVEAVRAAFGGGEAVEGGKAGREEEGELDHFLSLVVAEVGGCVLDLGLGFSESGF